ncbi:MAG: hypothetical protein J6D36_01350 [Erysipelotrichaceae bacterium]|nr:hypothetical protein [Erysipelotrichaceae bacterium]
MNTLKNTQGSIKNIVFLDIDGVLNCRKTSDSINGFVGIEDQKVALLKEIVEKTDSYIVLSSSWKRDWDPQAKEQKGILIRYMLEKLASQGLSLIDKTIDHWMDRGRGIYNWLQTHPHKNWIVLDDEIFPDYEDYGIMEHLIKTSFVDGGLQADHVRQAIELLNK